jgi:hypothetical protein
VTLAKNHRAEGDDFAYEGFGRIVATIDDGGYCGYRQATDERIMLDRI